MVRSAVVRAFFSNNSILVELVTLIKLFPTMKSSVKFIGLVLVILTIILHSCKKDKTTPPILTTTDTKEITQTTVTSGGNIVSDGGEEIIIAGICWSTSPFPSIKDKHTNDTSGEWSFTSNLTGLLPGTRYYIKAYAYNKVGVGYGNEVSFTTSPVVALATLSTADVTSITTNSAVYGGNITSDGGGSITVRGVCWSTTQNPTSNDIVTNDGYGTGNFTSNITGLQSETTYYIRSYATNSAGISYGNQITFTTIKPAIAAVRTSVPYRIRTTKALFSGKVENDGGVPVTANGFCWSTHDNPSVMDNIRVCGSGTGNLESEVTGLNAGTTYYVRAYATNSLGTAYGDLRSFTTIEISPIVFNTDLTYGTVSDVDDNSYKTIVIGTQTWMAENLKTTKYNDGTPIPNVTADSIWDNLTSPAYCWLFYDESSFKYMYGAIYNYFTVSTGKLCPAGWHVSTPADWDTLANYLGETDYHGGISDVGGKMKETGTAHWKSPNSGATNSSGFTGLPGGCNYFPRLEAGGQGRWWCSGPYCPSKRLHYDSNILDGASCNAQCGYSVRCVKD